MPTTTPNTDLEAAREDITREALAAAGLDHGAPTRLVVAALITLSGNLACDAAGPRGNEAMWRRSDLARELADELLAKLGADAEAAPAIPAPAAETRGWTINRQDDPNGDAVISITRPDWSLRIAGQFDDLCGVANVHVAIYFKSAPIMNNTRIEYLSAASQDPRFHEAIALAMAYASQLEAELCGEVDRAEAWTDSADTFRTSEAA